MQHTTTPPRQAFAYDEIQADNAFRYLILHPGSDDAPLECNLVTTFVDEAPPYEAISYVWGTDTLDQHITCNDNSLYITQNLAAALHRFRWSNTSRILWADSICIDQKNLKEKGQQVALMSQIYQRAARVLIYMGEDPDCHGPRVQSLVEDVVKMIEGEILDLPPLSWNSFPTYFGATPFVDDERWASLSALLKQDWFTRGWTVREAALAQYGNTVWGHGRFNWTSLMCVLNWLHKRAYDVTAKHGPMQYLALPHLDAYVDRVVHNFPYLSDRQTWHQNSLLDYLAAGRKLHMKDPRDRLYAFLDIAAEEGYQIVVDPRYGEKALQIYHDFAVSHIQTTKGVRILDYVIHDDESLKSGIPSWIPSWDHQENGPWREEGFVPFTSRTDTAHEPWLLDKNILRVHGVILGPVQYVSDTLDQSTVTLETMARIWAMVKPLLPSNSPTNLNFLRLFISTITQGCESGDPKTYFDLVTTYAECLEAISTNLDKQSLIEAGIDFSRIERWIHIFVNAKKFMLLDRGYMGLGPAVTLEGDMYGIIFGCTAPCILRATTKKNWFQYIGPCWISSHCSFTSSDGNLQYPWLMGAQYCKDWVDWDVGQHFIYLC